MLKRCLGYLVFLAGPVCADQQGPYSVVLQTGAAQVLRDRDYNPQFQAQGLFTTWIQQPEQGLQVRARYCLSEELSLADAPPATLVGIDLMAAGQVLIALRQPLGASPVQREEIRPGYYEYPMLPTYRGSRGFGHTSYFGAVSRPVFRPPAFCLAGSASFQFDHLAQSFAALPAQTLDVRLIFSTGETSAWRLGEGTVQELKKLTATYIPVAN